MEEINAERIEDVDMNSTAATFDNLTILKELQNISNLVRDADFLNTVPKAKLKRMKWVQVFNYLKRGILDDMVQELTSMWEFEGMSAKLEALEKQKEKFSEVDADTRLWRPQLGDVKAQLRSHDAANLQKQKKHLESLAKEYEVRVNRLKKTVAARRGYMIALQLDIQKYQKKNDELIAKINDKLEEHSSVIETIEATQVPYDENWTDKYTSMDIDRDMLVETHKDMMSVKDRDST